MRLASTAYTGDNEADKRASKPAQLLGHLSHATFAKTWTVVSAGARLNFIETPSSLRVSNYTNNNNKNKIQIFVHICLVMRGARSQECPHRMPTWLTKCAVSGRRAAELPSDKRNFRKTQGNCSYESWVAILRQAHEMNHRWHSQHRPAVRCGGSCLLSNSISGIFWSTMSSCWLATSGLLTG